MYQTTQASTISIIHPYCIRNVYFFVQNQNFITFQKINLCADIEEVQTSRRLDFMCYFLAEALLALNPKIAYGLLGEQKTLLEIDTMGILSHRWVSKYTVNHTCNSRVVQIFKVSKCSGLTLPFYCNPLKNYYCKILFASFNI